MKRETWADLFAAYQNPLYRYLYRMCGSREVAEELLQETFYRAMLSFTLRDAKAVRACCTRWRATSTLTGCADRRRKGKW